MSFFRSTLLMPVCLALVFFLVNLRTISNYNVNWDEPAHFARGQAYLHFFLSGSKNYRDLPNFENNSSSFPRYSIYQNNRDMEHFLKRDGGHPPLNGILAALSNYIFYQKLNLLGDIESYHVFILFISSVLLAFIAHLVKSEYGIFPSIVAILTLATYPSFIAESHNNIKDPVETTFFTLALYFFYRAVKLVSNKLVIVASVFAGLALGTKFNIFFAPLIGGIWILLTGRVRRILKVNVGNVVFFLVCIFIPAIIFFMSWPYLWQDPIANTLRIFGYYGNIGAGALNQPSLLIGNVNTYPLLWILYTTPLVTMALFLAGVVFFITHFKDEKKKLSYFALVWFLVTVGRVTFSGFSIYGGARQIMEYMPAMAILAGVGAHYIARRKTVVQIVIILLFIPIVFRIVSIHPNEVVYFNPLIGGLSGAKEKNFPSWGLSLGNSYRQGVNWINTNAEPNAQVALVVNPAPAIPPILFREDIQFFNGSWSGEEKKGEYLIETIFDNWMRVYFYPAEYVDRMLEPVYEAKVDNVAIAKVWKNDSAHTKPEFRNKKLIDSKNIAFTRAGETIEIALDEEAVLINVTMYYETDHCIPMSGGRVFISADGKTWGKLAQPVVEAYVHSEKLSYPIAGWSGRYIKFSLSQVESCPFDISNIQITRIL